MKNIRQELQLEKGEILLHRCYKQGTTVPLQTFIDRGGDINSTDSNGCTLLHIAANFGYSECVKILLDAGADMNKANTHNATPFFLAVNKGDYAVVKMFIEKDPSIVHDTDDKKSSAIHVAVTAPYPNVQIVNKLIESGVNIDAQNHEGYAPLHYASKLNKTEIVQALIDKGAKVNLKDNHGLSAFAFAQNPETQEIFDRYQQKLLEEAKCHPGLSDYKIQESLKEGIYIITIEHTDLLKILRLYFLLKRQKPELSVNFEEGKLILYLTQERGNELKDISSLCDLSDKNGPYEKMVLFHNSLGGILEIDLKQVNIHYQLDTINSNTHKRRNQGRKEHIIKIYYSFSDDFSYRKFKSFVAQQKFNYLPMEAEWRLGVSYPIKLDNSDGLKTWIGTCETLLQKAQEFKQKQKSKVVSKDKLGDKEKLQRPEEMRKCEEDRRAELRKKEELEREKEIERRKAEAQRKKIVNVEKPASIARAGKENIKRYNEGKKEKTIIDTVEDEKPKVTLLGGALYLLLL